VLGGVFASAAYFGENKELLGGRKILSRSAERAARMMIPLQK
jgi:hypothetical protein